MRLLVVSALLLGCAAPLTAEAQSGSSILGGQATAVQLTRAQVLAVIEHADYGSVSRLTQGPAGSWTAMTSKGAVKVNAAGRVISTRQP